jgi:tripartite-type tricarboxylate transporter receptor subunit TctC
MNMKAVSGSSRRKFAAAVRTSACVLAFVAFPGVEVYAQVTPAQPFYTGKQVSMLVGSAVGGGYDTYARLVARHLPRFVPGAPSIVVQNMPAAGSLVAMNTLANTSPRDGTTIGAVQNHIGIEPIMGSTGPVENARYDGRRMNWLGSTSKEIPVVVAWANSPIRTFNDTLNQEMLVGTSGAATADSVYARLMNQIIGTKFKIIEGYKGNPDLAMAAERGEIMGRTGWFVSGMLASNARQIADGQIRVLVQLASEKHPALPDVPLITDFIKDPAARAQIEFSLSWLAAGRPFVAPPDVPADRVKILRDGFMKAVSSAEFINEAHKMSLDVSPMSGEEVQALVERIYATPSDVIRPVKEIMAAK